MQLEDRVFSDPRIQELAADFVCVKADPQDPDGIRGAFKYKSGPYYPEVVFIDPDGDVVERLEQRTVEGAAATMESVLEAVRE